MIVLIVGQEPNNDDSSGAQMDLDVIPGADSVSQAAHSLSNGLPSSADILTDMGDTSDEEGKNLC